jgi:hypothetical protein
MDIDRDGFAQHIESGSGGLGRPGGGCRTLRHNTSGEHCADRNQRTAPHQISRRESVLVTAAIHAVLARIRRR